MENEIIVVEDEPKIAQILSDYLEQEGFKVTVLNSGGQAVETIQARSPAFVILDLMLPEKDGLSICREVRQFSEVPILMLTAKVDEIDRLLGLELGADDYVCKPFSPREVVLRVRKILQRVQRQPMQIANDHLQYDSVTLYPERFQCLVAGSELELTKLEFQLLKTLMTSPGQVFSRQRLMHLSYPDHRIVSNRTIDSHIKNLRKKLVAATGGKDLLHSIYGVGYRIE